MQTQNRPIVFLSVFKSGTEMMKRMIEELTALEPMEPEIIPGKVNYQDPAQLYYKPGSFYAWHLFPIPEVQKKLIESQARPVFMLRNVYDLVVSMYYHFAHNIDADVGRGRNVDHYFRAMSKEEGLSCIAQGMLKPDFVWRGIGPHCHQMVLMLEFASIYPCFVTCYEHMTQNKSAELQKLAHFLEIPLHEAQMQKIVYNSRFDVMKKEADSKNVGSHFRKGRSGSHAQELREIHIQQIQMAIQTHAPQLSELLAKANLSHILNVADLSGST
ncbi:MAG: sulfotransferase domain-containing protein [Magnetococcus sp. DMHC-6]